jgi:hypothetical protein
MGDDLLEAAAVNGKILCKQACTEVLNINKEFT